MIPKFRAWDKELQTMLDVSLIDFKKDILVGEHWKFGETNFMSFDKIELMQSTGLKDKNGKEIFEGDIVQFEDCYEVSDFLYINTGIIEWCQGGFHVTNRDSVLMEDLLDGDSLDVTIIGNIYENPELLEEK